jgi:hypothetical protein
MELMGAGEREEFERDGFVVLRGVLGAPEVAYYSAMVEVVYRRHRRADGALHQLSAVYECPGLAGLVDQPRVLGGVAAVLGWNVHVYHSHVDVHPPVVVREKAPRFEWHQDGGRQNRELETEPRPRMSVKAAYWLSDVSVPGRGNMKVVPGSHRTNWIEGPPRRAMRWPDPPGAVEITAEPGDVVLFDRRLWHARSENRSSLTRRAVFFGYTYRWVRCRDRIPNRQAVYTDVQRQLLGLLDEPDPDHAWGHDPETVPLYALVREAGRLDTSAPRS